MTFSATKHEVFNRGSAPDSFLTQLVEWAKAAPDELFAPNNHFDIFNKIKAELATEVSRDPGTGAPLYEWDSLLHRKAAVLTVMYVLALFESGCDWNEGVDSSRRTSTTKENAEAGAWQESWDARKLDASLADFMSTNDITDGVEFQQRMKTDHPLAMTLTALILRKDMKNFSRIPNGPLLKGEEREKTWPDRPKLWDAKQSIYPWLSRAACAEFQTLIAA